MSEMSSSLREYHETQNALYIATALYVVIPILTLYSIRTYVDPMWLLIFVIIDGFVIAVYAAKLLLACKEAATNIVVAFEKCKEEFNSMVDKYEQTGDPKLMEAMRDFQVKLSSIKTMDSTLRRAIKALSEACFFYAMHAHHGKEEYEEKYREKMWEYDLTLSDLKSKYEYGDLDVKQEESKGKSKRKPSERAWITVLTSAAVVTITPYFLLWLATLATVGAVFLLLFAVVIAIIVLAAVVFVTMFL